MSKQNKDKIAREAEAKKTILLLLGVLLFVGGATLMLAQMIAPTITHSSQDDTLLTQNEPSLFTVRPNIIKVKKEECSAFSVLTKTGVNFVELTTTNPNIIIGPVLPLVVNQSKNVSVCANNQSQDSLIKLRVGKHAEIIQVKVI